MPDSSLYRPCVGVALFNCEGLVFVGERIDTPDAWQMPQGGLNDGETVEQAAFRELFEEIGTHNAEILQVAPRKLRYELPPQTAENLWKSRYIGQEQSWVAARFLGSDAEINIHADATPEFSAWQWVKLEKTIDLIVPFKRDVYHEVIGMFGHLSKK
ncbi:MAG: RNA pyrophosphohydrolase [Alphaproteobacteria bacterium]